MQIAFLKELYAHMNWADSMVWRVTRTSDKGSSDDVLQEQLLHLHSTQRAFLNVWCRQPPTLPDRDDFGSAIEFQAWAQSYYPLANDFLESLSAAALDDVIDIPWARSFERELGGAAAPVTLGETIYQVAAHSTYHRGQVNRRLREIGAAPPLVDYIVWIWQGRPDPLWPRLSA